MEERLNDFCEKVEIQGLSYLFSGNIPEEDSAILSWTLYPPTWNLDTRIAQKVMTDISLEEPEKGQFEISWMREFKAGGISTHGKPQKPPIHIYRIDSHTAYYPTQYKYRGAKGIGRFLLSNFLALADLRKWEVFLLASASEQTAENKDHILDDDQLIRWYQRKGFVATNSGAKTLIREPQTPDLTQPIFKIASKLSLNLSVV